MGGPMRDVVDVYLVKECPPLEFPHKETREGPGLGVWLLPMAVAGSASWIALIAMFMR